MMGIDVGDGWRLFEPSKLVAQTRYAKCVKCRMPINRAWANQHNGLCQDCYVTHNSEPVTASEKTFWIVWSTRGDPTVRHATFESAHQESLRLAKKHPGWSFYVLKTVGMSAAPEPQAKYEKIEVAQ